MLIQSTNFTIFGNYFIKEEIIFEGFFFFNKTSSFYLFIFQLSLNPGGIQRYTDSVSNGHSGIVALEFCTNHATVSISTRYLSPDYSGLVLFATRSHCVVLLFVHKNTSLA